MSVNDDLVTWLRGQLDDDERVARAADGSHFYDCDPSECVDHHERWDDERVLAEVDAKRRILDGLTARRLDPAESDGGWEAADAETDGMASSVVRLLALPYADRPGYREDWRPSA